MSVSAGFVSGNSEPQPKAWPDSPGPRTGLLPGDRPAESTRHPLQERVREGNGGWIHRYRGEREIRKTGELPDSHFRTTKQIFLRKKLNFS